VTVSRCLAVIFSILFACGISAIAEASVGSPSYLEFVTGPSSGTDGVVLPVQPVVYILDSGDDFVPTATNTVTLTAYSNSACTQSATGTFSGSPVAAVNGVAEFSGVTFTGGPSTIYLGASSPGLSPACSGPIAIVQGSPTSLKFSALSATSGQLFAVQPVVEVVDPFVYLVPSATNTVTLNVYSDVGCTSPVTAGTYTFTANPVSAVGGYAAFSGLSYDGPPGAIYIGASSGSLLQACTGPIQISLPGSDAFQLGFTTEPSTTGNSGAALTVQPVVSNPEPYWRDSEQHSIEFSVSTFDRSYGIY
jgi:hypothetical protein